MSSPVDWAAAEAAWVTRVRAATGLADGQVVMGGQKNPRRLRPFITITIGDVIPLGAYDPTSHTYDVGADPGEEIIKTTSGLREFWVNLQAIAATVLGNATARALLAKVALGVHQQSSKDAFDLANLTVLRCAPVVPLPAEVFKTEMESRATLAVLCQGVLEVSEATGYIETGSLDLRTASTGPYTNYPFSGA